MGVLHRCWRSPHGLTCVGMVVVLLRGRGLLGEIGMLGLGWGLSVSGLPLEEVRDHCLVIYVWFPFDAFGLLSGVEL